VVYFPFGGTLFGFFSHNKLHGLGVLQFETGDIIAGAWEDGKPRRKVISKIKGVWREDLVGFSRKEMDLDNQKVILKYKMHITITFNPMPITVVLTCTSANIF